MAALRATASRATAAVGAPFAALAAQPAGASPVAAAADATGPPCTAALGLAGLGGVRERLRRAAQRI